jgi:hypothetical protein
MMVVRKPAFAILGVPMVNPTTFPILRRGASGPEAESSGPSGSILPYDNVVYFDPNTTATGETGSIADPYSTWAGWVGGVQTGSAGTWLVQFPGTAILPGADELPIEGINLVVCGLLGSDVGTSVTDQITIPDSDDATHIVAFRDISLESLLLLGGNYNLTFRDCVVSDMSESDDFNGNVYGFDSEFLIEMVTPEASVHLVGGSAAQWTAREFVLEGTIVGSKDLSSGGSITITGDAVVCYCRGVVFGPGSIIDFDGTDGELWLDGISYRSFIDSACNVINGVVVRDDGNWPRASAVYTGGPIDIDWFSNPLARYETDDGASVNFATSPLVREVQLMVVQDAEGGHEVGWPSSVVWTDGVPPDQDLTGDGVSIYRFFYEAGVYYGWVAGMNFLPP